MEPTARRLAASMVMLAAAAIAPAAVPAQPAAGGEIYVADVREAPAELGLSSSIELLPNGTFHWRFRVRQLEISARGEWEREERMIRLSNPEQVGQPEIEIAASSRDVTDTLRVSLEPATARMASEMELELEYPDNYVAVFGFDGGEVRIPAGQPRPIALRLLGRAVSFYTHRMEIPPDGDNVLTLRLVPADLGQAFFASQSMPFDSRGMTLDWSGIALRYNRVPAPRAGD